MSANADNVAHVKAAGQTRFHACHWPGCEKLVPPDRFGCAAHWHALPQSLRDRIWHAYRQSEETYIAVAREVQEWIAEHLRKAR